MVRFDFALDEDLNVYLMEVRELYVHYCATLYFISSHTGSKISGDIHFTQHIIVKFDLFSNDCEIKILTDCINVHKELDVYN